MKQMDSLENKMEEAQEMSQENSQESSGGKETPKNKKAIRDLIIVVLIFAAFPIVLRGGGGLLGIVIAAMIIVAAIVMLPVCLSLGLGFAGVLQIISGFSSLGTGPAGGTTTLIFGIGLLGAGVAAAVLSVKLYKILIPWVVRKFVKK